jgi:hypothetical protein
VLGGVQPLLDAARWFSLHLLFSAVCCNKDLADSLMEIDGWSPLAPKNYYDQKSILLESQDIISLQDGLCVTSMNKKRHNLIYIPFFITP